MYLTEEHEMIRKTVRDFAEREVRPVAMELDEKAEFSIGLTKRMGELGLFGLRTSAEYGGLNMDTTSLPQSPQLPGIRNLVPKMTGSSALHFYL